MGIAWDSDDLSHQFVFRRIPQLVKNATAGVVYASSEKNDLPDVPELVSAPTPARP